MSDDRRKALKEQLKHVRKQFRKAQYKSIGFGLAFAFMVASAMITHWVLAIILCLGALKTYGQLKPICDEQEAHLKTINIYKNELKNMG